MNLHDATLTYLTVVNETIREKKDYKDGEEIFKKMVNRRVEGTVTNLNFVLLYRALHLLCMHL